MSDDLRDELPDDLNAIEHAGPYKFPDNSRRRIPALLYWALAVLCAVVYFVTRPDSTLVNRGVLWAAIGLALVGLLSYTSGWRMHVDEKQALVAAQGAVGFPVGHASAQQVWRGLRSRPTWRVLAYSSENPPRQRALVLVDAVDGAVIEHVVQNTPEDELDDLYDDEVAAADMAISDPAVSDSADQ
ncbi:MAG TPA: hypothetical protein PKV27_08355 [Ilumatobacteraceae bacterium]|nr:hypothetical protein [Ilumatobacteraceae bacterium]